MFKNYSPQFPDDISDTDEKLENNEKFYKRTWLCKICNIECKSTANLRLHFTRPRHKDNEKFINSDFCKNYIEIIDTKKK